MGQAVHGILRFDRFALDLTRGCLRSGDEEIALRPKAFDMLRYLAQNPERLITKQDLYEAVWPDVTVSDDSIAQCIRELRDKLGDDNHSLIKTVSRRGYLFDTAVSAGGPEPRAVGGSEALHPQPAVAARASNILQAPPLRLGIVVAAALLSAALAIYLLGWPVAGRGQASIAERATPHPSFRDCTDCPDMVSLAAGEFMMGSPESERGRQDDEGAPRRVTIPKGFAIGKFEVTVDQFSTFIADTGITAGNHCKGLVAIDRSPPTWGPPEASFREPGFDVVGSQPVVCVSWHEAQAYVAWLRRRTGKPYRLPTEAEWEYAARAGTRTSYSFGEDDTALCAYARFADLSSKFGWHDACRSDTVAYGPTPVGSLKPNPWGLFDMHGNAWEWVEDCWTPIASDIPVDGSAFTHPGNCEMGVARGGSFAAGSRRVRSAIRQPTPTAAHNYNYGFRVALSLSD